VNRDFTAKTSKQKNRYILKSAQPIWTKFSGLLWTINAASWVVPRMRTTNPRWRTVAILKYLICNNFATIQPIETKFCRNMQIAIVNRTENENLHIPRIQNGGQPPYWK